MAGTSYDSVVRENESLRLQLEQERRRRRSTETEFSKLKLANMNLQSEVEVEEEKITNRSVMNVRRRCESDTHTKPGVKTRKRGGNP